MMTNREWLSGMALIDLLIALDFCPRTMNDCTGDCYGCRMVWLKEEHITGTNSLWSHNDVPKENDNELH